MSLNGKFRKLLKKWNSFEFQAIPVAPKWIVTLEDQAAADKLFLQADMDMDGFVSGSEIKDVFLQSRLPQSVLADIW